MEKNLFCLYGQIISPVNKNKSKKYLEVLLRLKDEEDNIISPGVFLDIAHRCCLMPQIDIWVIDNLFKKIVNNQDILWDNYIFSINLSGASLNQPNFLEILHQKIKEYN